MKTPALILVAVILGALSFTVGCDRQKSSAFGVGTHTLSSFDVPAQNGRQFPAQTIKLDNASLGDALSLYAEVSGRSVIRNINVPDTKITYFNPKTMSAVEVLQALDTVLAAQNIVTVYLGSQYVKVVPANQAYNEPGPVIDLPWNQLPDSSSFLIYVVKLRMKYSQAIPALEQFKSQHGNIMAIRCDAGGPPASKGSLPNLPLIFGVKDSSILIIRDYSSHVRRMLQVLEKMEQR